MKLRSPLILLAVLLAGCSPEPAPRLHDIVLVTIDTLRADHLSCYGYHRETTPTLDALAREGVLFERAITPIATTLPAHLSLMTGIYPHQHGYLTNSDAVASMFVPAPGSRPVAEVLRAAGYTTGAFVSGPTVTRATGIHAGFDHFDQHKIEDPLDIFDHSRRAAETIALALDWLRQQGGRPVFLWVHIWDPHEPNVPLEPWASMFPSDEGLERLIDERRIDPAVLRERFPDVELARLFAPELLADIRAQRPYELPPIDREAVRDMLNRYDADVRYVDDQLALFFDALRALGRFDDAILTVTSDHGQALGQHDWLEHGRIQLDNTHVPLVMRFPAGLVDQPARVPRVASLVDVMPTVLARLGAPALDEYLAQTEGEDLLSARFERSWAFSQRSERDREWEPGAGRNGRMVGLTLDAWRYYHWPDAADSEAADELYDLRTDPGELVDVHAREPDLVRRLRAVALEVLERRVHLPGATTTSPEAEAFRESLKSAGYLGDED